MQRKNTLRGSKLCLFDRSDTVLEKFQLQLDIDRKETKTITD